MNPFLKKSLTTTATYHVNLMLHGYATYWKSQSKRIEYRIIYRIKINANLIFESWKYVFYYTQTCIFLPFTRQKKKYSYFSNWKAFMLPYQTKYNQLADLFYLEFCHSNAAEFFFFCHMYLVLFFMVYL